MTAMPASSSQGTAEPPQRRPWWKLRRGCLHSLLVALLLPLAICGGTLAIFMFSTAPSRQAIRQAHEALQPGVPLRSALATLVTLNRRVFVKVSQEDPAGATPLEWLADASTLDAFASRVRPGRPLRVEIATTGSRQTFAIELDASGAIRAVSAVEGHAD